MTHNRLALGLVCSCLFLFGLSLHGQDRPLGGPTHNQGAQLFESNCAFCHGSDGKGGRGPAIATLPKVIALSDEALIGIVHNGETDQGMPGFPDLGEQGTKAVVQYLRSLQGVTGATSPVKLTGNPNAGRQLFFGNAQCSTCHMVAGKGGFMSTELTSYATNRTPGEILRAIVNPDADLKPTSRVIKVRTKAGENLTGVLRAEDNLNITLQTQDGQYHFLPRRSLATVNYTDHSLMPHDYGVRLSSRELDDLVSFLIVAARNAPSEPAPTKSRSHDW
jgi:cytochrome c oxidase cbb3-type subunit III